MLIDFDRKATIEDVCSKRCVLTIPLCAVINLLNVTVVALSRQ